jgi:GH24 family phage-related lysozyme (muramidase)
LSFSSRLFSYDVSVWNYNYPDTFAGESTNFADLSDGIITIGYGPVSYTHIKTIAGGSGTAYQSYDLALGDFTLTYGDHKAVATEDHFSVGYAYNDNLTFTAVFPIEPEDSTSGNASDPLFNVALSLPIE